MILLFFLGKPALSHAADIVNPKETYTYDIMVQDIKALGQKYPDIIQYKIIGSSEYKRPIYAVSLGTGNANVFINGSHHAREWISTTLNMYMLEQYAKMYEGNQTFGSFNVKKVLDETTIWFVPMVNPDGVTLQQFGLSKFPVTDHNSLIKMNEYSHDFKKWKANAKGVDLNRQYNAGWATIKSNRPSPSWSHHKGYYPEQAAETKTMVKFTKEINPEMAVSYHSSGEILYWKFKQSGQQYTRDHNYAKRIGQYTGYSLVYPGLNPSGGGYNDWFTSTYKRPGFTPELGRYAGNTHVPLSEFNRIWSQNQFIGLYTASEGYKLYLARGGKPKYQEVNVKIDGEIVKFEQPALLIDGKTVVPLRGVFEHFGAIVEWEQSTKTITARKGTTIIELTVGSKTMMVNGNSKSLEVAPQMVKNHTMIPLRAVSEAFGAEVSWDAETKTAMITSPAQELDEIAPVQPAVDPITDVTLSVTGSSEVNALIEVKKDGVLIAQGRTNANGRFVVNIQAQTADTLLSITATDLAGNMSEVQTATVTYTNSFTDTINHWAKEDIGFLKDRKVTNGLPDGSFGVEKNISRAEAAAFLVRALKLDLENHPNPNFPDVEVNHDFYSYIAAISATGIMTGDENGLFNPNQTLTRAEMAKILVTAYKLTSQGETTYPDVSHSHWAHEVIGILGSYTLTNGYPDGTFRADAPIKRSEFAALLARVMILQEKGVLAADGTEESVEPSDEAEVVEQPPNQDEIIEDVEGTETVAPEEVESTE